MTSSTLPPVWYDRDRYSLPSRITEAQLLGVPILRTEPCACGDSITAPQGDEAVLAAVQTHNATEAHRTWRRQSAGSGPTAARSPVDVSEEASGASGRSRPAGDDWIVR